MRLLYSNESIGYLVNSTLGRVRTKLSGSISRGDDECAQRRTPLARDDLFSPDAPDLQSGRRPCAGEQQRPLSYIVATAPKVFPTQWCLRFSSGKWSGA